MNRTGTKRSVGVLVKGDNAESLERALKILKRKLKKDNFFRELREREYYMKPSEKKKMKRRRRKTADGDEFE